ncbi:MAG: class I tRNA ligase family protein [Candidatus Marinimicrobia bacterium]|nr:class I tRNA ligase family protein [Candidatus Neomarinimicrobiota bacterium]
MYKPVSSKVDFVQLEHQQLKFWEKTDIFDKRRKKNEEGPRWSFLDGPITANNPMGVHHAWGRTLKDIFNRYHSMLGRNSDIRTVSTVRGSGSKWRWKRSTVSSPRPILKISGSKNSYRPARTV